MRWLSILVPFVIPISVHLAYEPINENWTVRWFGCGCPSVVDPGEFRFNANHFNAILWTAVLIGCAWHLWHAIGVCVQRWRELAFAFTLPCLGYLCFRFFAHGFWL